MQKRHQNRLRRKLRAKTSDVLPATGPRRSTVSSRWRKHYAVLRRLRSRLLARQADFGRDSFQEGQNPAVTTHIADTATDEFDRDLAVSMLSSRQDALYEIDAAIQRIEDRSYGTCELTGRKIDPERLAAIPWTRFSAEAEKDLERRGEIRAAHLGKRATMANKREGAGTEEDGEEERD